MLDMLRLRWEAQEKARLVWQARAKEIEEGITDLENATWNKDGAVEDMGVAS
jgi:hypothetical protein